MTPRPTLRHRADPLTPPYATITADEQAAVLAATLPRLHPTTYPVVLAGAPAWCAIDALRHHGDWLTWDAWLHATATALALAGHHHAGAEQACRDASILVHETPDGRAVGLYEIEHRHSPRDPWRARARRFQTVTHPPLRDARYIPETRRRPATPEPVQLSLLEAA